MSDSEIDPIGQEPEEAKASPEDLTRFLNELSQGRLDAATTLMPYVYGELLAIAENQLQRERKEHTLQPTELVNEAFLRLFKTQEASWNDRRHFFSLAAKAMRQLLVDHARRRNRLKRGGGQRARTLDEAFAAGSEFRFDLLDLNHALEELAETNPVQANVVELRYFGGLEMAEVASVLSVSQRTVERQWRTARAWLGHRLEAGA